MHSILMALIATLGVLILSFAPRLGARAAANDSFRSTLLAWAGSLAVIAVAWILLVWLQR
jgi:hypothetical protein